MENCIDHRLIANPYDDRLNRLMVVAPTELSDLAVEHVRKIFERGYAKDVSKEDFFHGHVLIVDLYPGKPFSIDEWLLRPKMILYHTRERILDWNPLSERNIPRSIIGLSNGELVLPGPTDEQRLYREFGTIRSTWPFTIDGQIVTATPSLVSILVGDGQMKTFNEIFYFLKSQTGKYIVNDQIKIEFYLGLMD